MLPTNTNIAAYHKTASTIVRDTSKIKTAADLKMLTKINAATLFNTSSDI